MLTAYYAISVSITPWSTAVLDFILITHQTSRLIILQNVEYKKHTSASENGWETHDALSLKLYFIPKSREYLPTALALKV